MSRSAYIYLALAQRKAACPVIACTVKYEFLNRVRQALNDGNLKVGEFELYRIPDNGLPGNGTIITNQFQWR